jgi:SAM-dependent methyltransferase
MFTRLSHYGIGEPGQQVLDVGTGTGALAREFARRGCSVTGIDPSAELLEQAQVADREAGVVVKYLQRSAEDLGGVGESFDVATAGRCWHWFDRPRAAAELRRVLAPGGTLAILHFDRVRPSPDGALEATERLVAEWNPSWAADSPPEKWGGGVGIYRDWAGDVTAAGFTAVETFSFDVEVPYTHEAWRGRVRSGGGVGGTLSSEDLARFDAELADLLAREFPHEPVRVTQRAFALVCRR